MAVVRLSKENASSFGVITCSDGRMLPAACCALLSARRNIARPDARFLLLAIDVDERGKADIAAFCARHDLRIEILDFVSPSFEGQSFGRWPTSAVARLYMDFHVPGEITRLLYLDADTVVAAPLDELFTLDMRGHMIGAVEDYLMAFPAKIGRRMAAIGMAGNGRYFNSGVLLIDWARIGEHNIIRQARDLFAADSNRYDCPDQDALNVVVDGDWLPLHPRWNCQTGIMPFISDPAILHFTGKRKPWHDRVRWPHRAMRSFYRNALAQTPWSDFCAAGSLRARIGSYLSHYPSIVASPWKVLTVRRYFTQASETASPAR